MKTAAKIAKKIVTGWTLGLSFVAASVLSSTKCEAQQSVAFTADESVVAVDLLNQGFNPDTVLFDEGLWRIVRNQVQLQDAVIGEYDASDFALRLTSPVTHSGIYQAIESSGVVIDVEVAAYQILPLADLPRIPADFRVMLSERQATLAYVAGLATTSRGSVAFLGSIVTAMNVSSATLVSSLIIADAAPPTGVVLTWIDGVRSVHASGLASLDMSQIPVPDDGDQTSEVRVVWSCATCALCAGAAGVSCGYLCLTDGYWDVPGEGSHKCFAKCLRAVPGASDTYDIACFTACAACTGRSAFPSSSATPAPVPWEIMSGSVVFADNYIP